MERQSRSPIDINSAREEELTQLPRIGVDRARHIIHHRRLRKGFRDWEDLARTVEISPEDIGAIRAAARIGPRQDETAVRETGGATRDAQPVRRPHPRSR